MPRILGLDVSQSSTGYAYGEPGQRPVSGAVRLAPAGAMPEQAWREATRWTMEAINTFKPDVVAIEAPIASTGGGFTDFRTQGLLWGLQAHIRTAVWVKTDRRAVLVSALSARKTLVGRGTFPSGTAKLAVKARCIALGWADAATSFDRCDAMCVWAHLAADAAPAWWASLLELTPELI